MGGVIGPGSKMLKGSLMMNWFPENSTDTEYEFPK